MPVSCLANGVPEEEDQLLLLRPLLHTLNLRYLELDRSVLMMTKILLRQLLCYVSAFAADTYSPFSNIPVVLMPRDVRY